MTLKRLLNNVLWILVAGFGLYLLLPSKALEIAPSNLDGSWRVALQVAFDKNLVFGRDFIFTYGPLGFLSGRVFAESTRWFTLTYDLFVTAQLILLCVTIYRRSCSLCSLALLFGVLFVMANATYFLEPAIIMFLLSTFWLFESRESRSRLRFMLALLNALLAFYIKVNLGIAAIGQVAVVCLLNLVDRERRANSLKTLGITVLIFALSPLLVSVDIFSYTRASLHIANGFNDAMYLDLSDTEYLNSALATLAGLLLISIATIIWGRIPVVVISCAGFSFLLFKQAFVRADDHIYVFYDYIVAPFALLAFFSVGKLRVINSVALAIVVSAALYESHMPSGMTLAGRTEGKWLQLLSYADSFSLERSGTHVTAVLGPDLIERIGQHSVDLMPDNTSILFHAGLNYIPRPVIQSYTSYDHYLDQVNARFLAERGQDRIIFSHGCIDYRYCLHDETETKLSLLRHYDLETESPPYFLLKRRDIPLRESRTVIASGRMRFGKRLYFKPDGTLKIAQLKIKYSGLGRLRRFAYKPHPLKITVSSRGRKATFRAVVPILHGGVIANLAVDDSTAVPNLLKRDFARIPPVEFIRIHSDHSNNYARYFDYEVYQVTYE